MGVLPCAKSCAGTHEGRDGHDQPQGPQQSFGIELWGDEEVSELSFGYAEGSRLQGRGDPNPRHEAPDGSGSTLVSKACTTCSISTLTDSPVLI